MLERKRAATTSYVVLATLVTDADGVARFVYKPSFNADYTVRYDGSPILAPSRAGPKRVDVAPRLTAKLSKTAARVGSKVTLSGSHDPAALRAARCASSATTTGPGDLVTTRTLSTTGPTARC